MSLLPGERKASQAYPGNRCFFIYNISACRSNRNPAACGACLMEKMPLGNTSVPDAVPDEACSSGFHRKDWLRSVRDIRFPGTHHTADGPAAGPVSEGWEVWASFLLLSLPGGSPNQKSSVSGGLTNLLWGLHVPALPAGAGRAIVFYSATSSPYPS